MEENIGLIQVGQNAPNAVVSNSYIKSIFNTYFGRVLRAEDARRITKESSELGLTVQYNSSNNPKWSDIDTENLEELIPETPVGIKDIRISDREQFIYLFNDSGEGYKMLPPEQR